jgi:hypothetical protein
VQRRDRFFGFDGGERAEDFLSAWEAETYETSEPAAFEGTDPPEPCADDGHGSGDGRG